MPSIKNLWLCEHFKEGFWRKCVSTDSDVKWRWKTFRRQGQQSAATTVSFFCVYLHLRLGEAVKYPSFFYTRYHFNFKRLNVSPRHWSQSIFIVPNFLSLLLSLSFQNVEYSGTHATVFFLQIGAGPQEKHIRRIYWEVGGARQYNAQCIETGFTSKQ